MMAGLADAIGAPYGNRTRVSAVKGRRPGPLDEGRMGEPPGRRMPFWIIGRRRKTGFPHLPTALGGTYSWLRRERQAHQWPVFDIDFQGSCGGRAGPFCRSSTEWLSGERTKAITPSRGGRWMVTPAFIRRSQVA